MEIKTRRTERGFIRSEFIDFYGSQCSLQESSIADAEAIWLGVNDADPQIMRCHTPQGGVGWVKYDIPDNVHFTTRMHLTREQVANLLPALQHFVDTGELFCMENEK